MRIFNKFQGTKGFITTWERVIRFRYMIQEKAKEKCRILAFWDKHGTEATEEAFKVKKRTLFLWKRKLRDGGGKLEALNDKSRAPKARRKRLWHYRILEELRRLREVHPNLGEKKVSHFGKIRRANRQKVLRKPKDFKTTYPGHLVALDTIERFVNGCRRYVITFEDIHTRFAFAWSTTSHASLAAQEFFRLCLIAFPFSIDFVLTDNGSEFKKHFNEELLRLHLIHYHTYPRTPKMNAHVERFNRTIQEEFVDYHTGSLLEPQKFNLALMDWLVFYNTERVHEAFGNKLSPMQFMVQSPYYQQKCKSGWGYTV